MNCWYCERPAHGVCQFCGRAVCREHTETLPYIVEIYRNDQGVYKALVVANALFCGVCQPKDEPVELPQLC